MPVLTDLRHGLLRYATGVYITDNPTIITLQRKVNVAKPGGGHDKLKVDLAPQVFRLINDTSTGGMALSGTDDGETHQYSYTLIGKYDADLQVDDTWEEDGRQYHVDGILPNNGYETRASVTGFAMEPTHG